MVSFEITDVKKQNSLYYSVFFNRWESCKCSSTFDTVLIKSEVELSINTPGLSDLVSQELLKR